MKSFKKILIGVMFGQILILSNCTKPNHEEPPPPSGVCNLSVDPKSTLIDLSKADTPKDQVFVVSGDNAERAEWSLDNTGCAGIEGNSNQRTSVKVTANQSVTEQCTAEIFAKTSSDCFAKAVLTVIPKKISLACVSIIQSGEKIISGSAANFTATDGSSNGQPIADSVQWSTIDTENCSDTKIQSPNNAVTSITGVNKKTSDCVVTVQVERPSIPNCKAQTALTIEAPQNPTCNLDYIGPQESITIDNGGGNTTLTAYTSGNNPTPVNWAVSNQEGQCKGTITGASTNVPSAQITGTNDGNSPCTITVEAKENSTQSCQAKTKVITIKPKNQPTDCITITHDGPSLNDLHSEDTVTFNVADQSKVTWKCTEDVTLRCYCAIDKRQNPDPSNYAKVFFHAEIDNCIVSVTAEQSSTCTKKFDNINVKKDLRDNINITAKQKNLITTAGFNIPHCGDIGTDNLCLEIRVNNVNNTKDVYLGFPTFSLETGALHIQKSPTSSCDLHTDLTSPANSTKLPAGAFCKFYVYLQSSQQQPSSNTTLTLPYVSSDPTYTPSHAPIQMSQMIQTINYTITPATVGTLCIKINSGNGLTKQNFIDNPIQLVPNINKTFQFSDDISQPACIDNVPTGDYTVIAPTVAISPDTYSPNTKIQTVTISTNTKEEISLQYSKDPQPDPNTGVLCVSIQAEGLDLSDLQSDYLFSIQPHVGGFVFSKTPQNNFYKACLRVLDTNYNIVAKSFCIPSKTQCYEPSRSQLSQTISVLPGTADNTLTLTYTESSKEQEHVSNWSIYGNTASDQPLWQTGNFYGSTGVQEAWNKEGLSDAFKDMDPTAWDALMKDMKGDFRKSLPNIVSYSYFDRARANKVNANCTYIQQGSWTAIGAKCDMVYQGSTQKQQCYIKFQPNAAPKFCMGFDFNESQFKCGNSDNLWSSKGCFLSQSSERQPADDWCMLDPRGENMFWCRNWYPETIDLRNISDLKLYQANPNLEQGTAFACAAPGVKLATERKWGGIGIGKDVLRYDPSIALNDIRYTSVSGENLDPVFMYKNPFSDKQFTKQEPIKGFDNFDPNDTKFVNAFLNLCDRNKNFCLPPKNKNNEPQLALAHIFGRSGPMVNSAYAKYVKDHAKGYYSWQYDDGDALHQCNLSDTKLVVYMCGDNYDGDTTLKSRYTDLNNINELFGAAMQNQGIKSSRLMVVNNCSETIWIQQTLRPEVGGDPAITKNTKNYLVELPARNNGTSYSQDDVASVAVYETPDEGLQSFRIWAKQGCKNTNTKTEPYYAYNCKVGNTGPNDDPDNKGLYVQPDAQTIFEATFGCFSADTTKCYHTKNGNRLDPGIWYDISTVDGFTLKASVQAVIVQKEKEHPKCLTIATPTFSVDECPTNVDLSTTPGT